ncbi:hypothetical protein [uncultured Methanolobus sp.]|uniref:hypothetical protein n=1 Tax=uncultured Methanolobus sp. TaxID=218300 RepID=UPI002AAA73A2|nr:hypothetical protein [uncultured Methanolobus sp.]
MRRELTISFTLLMIMFSTTIPGVYALEDNDSMQMPAMPDDADSAEERTGILSGLVNMIRSSFESIHH